MNIPKDLKENIFPFNDLSDNEFYISVTKGLNVDGLTKVNFPTPPLMDHFNKVNKFINRNIKNNPMDDNDDEESDPINCKYYDIDEFNREKLNSTLLSVNWKFSKTLQ